jgi:RimJ/RimL family protein N-acetyltransferase
MEIRALSSADAESFKAIRRDGLENSPRSFSESLAEHDALSPKEFAKRLASSTSGDSCIIGAFIDSELVGVAGFGRNPRTKLSHKGMIWGVYVRPAFRGAGIARAILLEVIRRAKTIDGLDQINLTVAEGTPAKQLYLSLGFEVFGHEPNSLKVDGEYLDEDLMVLRLESVGAL